MAEKCIFFDFFTFYKNSFFIFYIAFNLLIRITLCPDHKSGLFLFWPLPYLDCCEGINRYFFQNSLLSYIPRRQARYLSTDELMK